jgi:hypothetical protein
MKKYLIEKLNALIQLFFSGSVIDCEKHLWVKMANGKWCEKCNKWSERYH